MQARFGELGAVIGISDSAVGKRGAQNGQAGEEREQDGRGREMRGAAQIVSVRGNQQKERGCAVERVMRQLGSRKRKEGDDESRPNPQIPAQTAPGMLAGIRFRAKKAGKERPRPGQQQEGRGDEVIEQASRMTFERAGKAFDIVLEEKAIDECLPVRGERRGIPGHDQQGEDQPAEGIGQRAQPDAPILTACAIQETYGSGHDERDRPLGERAEPDPDITAQQRRALSGFEMTPCVEQRKRQQ